MCKKVDSKYLCTSIWAPAQFFLPLYTSPVNIKSNGCNVTNADFNLKVLTKVEY